MLALRLFIIGIVSCFFISCSSETSQEERIASQIGVEIPSGFEVIDENIEYLGEYGQDYTYAVIYQFKENDFVPLIDSIERAIISSSNWGKYPNKPDGEVFWEYAKQYRLTGYWVKNSSGYEFYEPSYNELPTSYDLFGETWHVSAHVNTANRTLNFEYSKI